MIIEHHLQSDKYSEKYEIIGLTYNDITEEKMFEDIKKYDTEDDWTYWVKDEDLKGDVRYFLERNKIFNEKFKKYGIKSFDTSHNREEVLNQIVDSLESLEKCQGR